MRRWIGWVMAAALMIWPAGAYGAHPFVAPTAEELAMKELPGYPGVAGVVLYREEIDDGAEHRVRFYDRIKVLTVEGKKYATVEIGGLEDGGFFAGRSIKAQDVVGRTVHPDGTIVVFAGKPYLKTEEKSEGVKAQTEVFTMPDVDVGSIVEYSYEVRLVGTNTVPDWYLQDDLYVKSEYFRWRPATVVPNIAYYTVLPPGATVVQKNGEFEIALKDLAPTPHEQFMPPMASVGYRVSFNYSAFSSIDAFWSQVGASWSKGENDYIDVNSELKKETGRVIAGATTQDEKLRKIYAFVMTLENTDYTRERTDREDKAAGLKEVTNVLGVLKQRRGAADVINDLFIGMARAAGMKAYDMVVPDRSRVLFTLNWMSFQQFSNRIAIVTVDGKEQFFDPGARYCQYGRLAWQHTLVMGLRQTEKVGDKMTNFAVTPGDSYTVNTTGRAANLTVNEAGGVTGTVVLTLSGAPALGWRHVALREDSEGLRRGLEADLQSTLAKTLDVKIVDVQNVDQYEKPFVAKFEVKGTLGTLTGKRLVLPVDVFEANVATVFPSGKRETAVYFHFPEWQQDAQRITFPKGLSVEEAPGDNELLMAKAAKYKRQVVKTAESLTMRRDFIFAQVIVDPKDYEELRKFYAEFESKDQESVVLKVAAAGASAGN